MVSTKKYQMVVVAGLTALAAGVLGTSGQANAASLLQVTPTSDANILANTISGSGVVLSGATYTGAPQAAGVFSNGNAAGLGIDSGILLTTGKAADAANPSSTSNVPSTNNGTPGDPQLSALLQGFTSTYDASELQFNFTLAQGTDNLSFKYAFASTEYPNFVNSPFNDVLGFLVDGKNIALLPGTNTPVSANTINGGNPLGTNPQNSQLYVNNFPGSNVPSLPNNGTPASKNNIAYRGFTVPLTATITGLAPGQHTIKLAASDTSDPNLDSAVFIQSKSFSSTPTASVAAVPEPSLTWGLLATWHLINA